MMVPTKIVMAEIFVMPMPMETDLPMPVVLRLLQTIWIAPTLVKPEPMQS